MYQILSPPPSAPFFIILFEHPPLFWREVVVVAFSSCLDVAAIEMEIQKPLDYNRELQTARPETRLPFESLWNLIISPPKLRCLPYIFPSSCSSLSLSLSLNFCVRACL